jgi:predicted nucleic acid-binding protein
MSVKIFLDANILVSVLNKEYPLFPYTSRIVSAGGPGNFKVLTSPLCLAIAFYFAEKKSGTATARKKINLLSQNLDFTTIGPAEVLAVASNKKILDVEDGLQYYSALDSGCKVIVTEDRNDFWFSEIEVLTSRRFLEKYVF